MIKNYFCKCGCGRETNNGSDYLRGHYFRGRKQSLDQIEKLRLSLRRYFENPANCEANRQRQIVAQNKTSVIAKKSAKMKMLRNTPEARRANSIAQNRPETKAKRSKSLKIANKKEDVILRRSIAAKKSWQDAAAKLKRSAFIKESWVAPGAKEKRTRNLKKAHNTPTAKERHSQAQKKLWANPIIAAARGRAMQLHPNKPETFLLSLLEELYPGEWKYTGDFSFTIDGKSPDFTNTNGQKKLIELFGDYWHRGENPQDRIDIFKPFGFDTLVIWENELKDENVLRQKIADFSNG